MKKNTRTSLSSKLMGLSIFLVVCICTVICIFVSVFYQKQVKKLKEQELSGIVEAVASSIDGDKLEQLKDLEEVNVYQEQLTAQLTQCIERTELHFLYIVTPISEKEVVYLAEGDSPYIAENDKTEFKEVDNIENFGESLLQVQQGKKVPVEFYVSEEYGQLASVYVPIYNEHKEIVAILGGDLSAKEIATITRTTVLAIIGVTLIVAIIFCFAYYRILYRILILPIKMAETAAQALSRGKCKIELPEEIKRREDEIGSLFCAFQEMGDFSISIVTDITRILGNIAEGNLQDTEPQVEYIGDYQEIGDSLQEISVSLRAMIQEIVQVSNRLQKDMDQISISTQDIAQGATEQAGSVKDLAENIQEISEQMLWTANGATTMSAHVTKVGDAILANHEQMQEVISAIEAIKDSSDRISYIVNTINDIAFQTNILALNAAVEAARAGTLGKGFAVVADEVKMLAEKSGEAAKHTAELIQHSIFDVERGVKLANETASILTKVVEETKEMTVEVEEIAETSKEQANEMEQVRIGIDQISTVVDINANRAEETSAANEKLLGESEKLQQLVERFRL